MSDNIKQAVELLKEKKTQNPYPEGVFIEPTPEQNVCLNCGHKFRRRKVLRPLADHKTWHWVCPVCESEEYGPIKVEGDCIVD